MVVPEVDHLMNHWSDELRLNLKALKKLLLYQFYKTQQEEFACKNNLALA